MTTSIGMNQPQYPRGAEAGKGPRGPKGTEGMEKPETNALTTTEETTEDTAVATPNVDTYVPSSKEESTDSSDSSTEETSGYGKPNKALVNQLKTDLAQNSQNFVNKMVSMITGQASAAMPSTSLSELIGGLEVSAEDQAAAQEAISEDGYWGVEQTANRIVDMAMALAGNDSAKADEMMAAIEKGYAAAEKAWGGELPSITADTKTRIDELFADWKGES